MNTKHYLAAIFAAAILSISFISCEEKEDEPTTTPTTEKDIVAIVHSFLGKNIYEIDFNIIGEDFTGCGTYDEYSFITFYNSDTTKEYNIRAFNDTVILSSYKEAENSKVIFPKLQVNANKFISKFVKWETSLNKLFPSNAEFHGYLSADNNNFYEYYNNHAQFKEDYITKLSTLNDVYSKFNYNGIYGKVGVNIDYIEDFTSAYISFSNYEMP